MAVLAGTIGTGVLAASSVTLSTVRINAGGPALTDVEGNKWKADTDYTGGRTSTTKSYIGGTPKQYVFHDDRYGMSAYRIPVVSGTYNVNLLEVETYFNAPGKRVFSVTAEGLPVARNVDIFKLAGGKNKAIWLQFTTTVTDGKLDLGFTRSVNYSKVSGITVVPAASAAVKPSPTTQPTVAPSVSPTASPTVPPSPSASPTPSASPSPSVSPTPSASPTPTSASRQVFWGMDDNADFDSVEANIGHKFAVAREYRRIDQSFLTSREQSLVNSGHSLVLSVKSRTGSAAVPFSDIVAGKWDSQLLSGLTSLNGLSTPTYFIFEHEADSTAAKASCSSSSDSVCGPQFVAAWRHVYNLAKAHNLNRLSFVWTVTSYGFNPQTNVRNNYYWPGTAYTDWIGVDAYNGGCNGSWYGSFADTMKLSENWLQANAPGVPVMIPELGATEGSTADAKANFFNGMPAALNQAGYSNIKAIMYWNDKQPSCDFRVNSSQQSFNAYRALSGQTMMAARPAF